jgi:hypothetical protein
MRKEREQAAVTPENAPQGNSDESKPKKSGRGGAREGAGRPPSIKRIFRGLTRETIAEAATRVDWGEVLVKLTRSKSDRTVLETVAFFRDTLIGRPAQNVQVAGAMVHAVWTPGCMDKLTAEEIALLDKLTAKLAAPASNALPDGPQNQIESNTAI